MISDVDLIVLKDGQIVEDNASFKTFVWQGRKLINPSSYKPLHTNLFIQTSRGYTLAILKDVVFKRSHFTIFKLLFPAVSISTFTITMIKGHKGEWGPRHPAAPIHVRNFWGCFWQLMLLG